MSYSWDPNVTLQRFSCNQKAYPFMTRSAGLDRYEPENYSLPRWLFDCVNEDYYTRNPFIGFTYGWALFPCTWTWQAYPGCWRIRMGLDKLDYDLYRNQFTFVGFDDNFSTWPTDKRPPLNLDIRTRFRMRNINGQGAYCAEPDGYGHPVGWFMARAMLGAVARWNQRVHYLEVVLWSTDTADQVTPAWNRWGSPPGQLWRDVPGNLYQRRSWFGTGECVFYNGDHLNLLPDYWTACPRLTTKMQDYDIHLARLFRATHWSDPPASWGKVKINGVYLGVECWGAVKYIIEHEQLNTYRVE